MKVAGGLRRRTNDEHEVGSLSDSENDGARKRYGKLVGSRGKLIVYGNNNDEFVVLVHWDDIH